MEQLIRLIEKRKEIGKRPSYMNGGNINDFVEYNRIGDMILKEVCRLYDEGKLVGGEMGLYKQEAKRGKRFLLTKKGYDNTPDCVKQERKIGEPIKGFETSVPVSWMQKGYVEEK